MVIYNPSLEKVLISKNEDCKIYLLDVGTGKHYLVVSKILVVLSLISVLSLILIVGYFGLIFLLLCYYIYSTFNSLYTKTDLDEGSKYLESILFENTEINSKIKDFELLTLNPINSEQSKIELDIFGEQRNEPSINTVVFKSNSVILHDSQFYQLRFFGMVEDFQFITFHPDLSGYEFSDRISLIIELEIHKKEDRI